MSSAEAGATKPEVLFVYYTHTQQALRVCEAMTEVLRERGCNVTQAGIEFTDPHYAKNFGEFPFRHAVFGILPLLLPQLRQKTGEIRIPEAAQQGDYDLVCFGSPTWFFRTSMPLRSYLWSVNLKEVKKRGIAQGGTYVDGIRFTYEGGQIRSLLSLLSYFGKGEMRERSLGINIPPTNLKLDFREEAQAFADKLADGLGSGNQNPMSKESVT